MVLETGSGVPFSSVVSLPLCVGPSLSQVSLSLCVGPAPESGNKPPVVTYNPRCSVFDPCCRKETHHAIHVMNEGRRLIVIRYRKDKVQSKLTPTFPLVSGLKDLSNGCALAAVLHYYCPALLPLEDVCLKDTMSVADSVYNLQLIRAFCNTHLQQCCPLQVEDLLYTPPLLHTNILAFLAELMDFFEVQKPDFVQPLQPVDLTDISGVLDCTSPVGCHTNSSPSYIFKQPFVPVPSEVSAENQSWTKKQISGPLSAVAFSIPFGLDSDVDIVMGNPIDFVLGPVSSASRDVPAPAYSPPEDLSHLMSNSAPAPRSWGPYCTPMGELPTIEEVLQLQVGVSPREMHEPLGPPELLQLLVHSSAVQILSDDVKSFGYSTVLQPLLKDLATLETEGLYIPSLGKKINEEFKRITTVRLESTFMAQLDHCISKLMEIGSDRGGATGQKIRKIRECLLQSKNVEVDARREAAIRALIVYLHEKEEDLFAHFDSTDDYEVGFHRLTMSIAIIGEESSATRTGAIVIEGTQVIMEKNIPRVTVHFKNSAEIGSGMRLRQPSLQQQRLRAPF
uniref:Calponin-homology (CH) domain-containing protein n=1 Tax=Knipowitschia caucasica TaxID=637954 RepID=A0AAV2LEW4_KNICA